jgi:hypothetical protein
MVRGCMILFSFSAAAFAVDIPDTLVVDGQTYTGVIYRSHNAARLNVMHDTGLGAFPIASLPVDLQTKLGFDEKEAAKVESALAERQRQIAIQMQQQRQAAIEQKRVAAEEERAAREAASVQLDTGASEGRPVVRTLSGSLEDREARKEKEAMARMLQEQAGALSGAIQGLQLEKSALFSKDPHGSAEQRRALEKQRMGLIKMQDKLRDQGRELRSE